MNIDDAYHQFCAINDADWPEELRAVNSPAALFRRQEYFVRWLEAVKVFALAVTSDTKQHCPDMPVGTIGDINACLTDTISAARGMLGPALGSEAA